MVNGSRNIHPIPETVCYDLNINKPDSAAEPGSYTGTKLAGPLLQKQDRYNMIHINLKNKLSAGFGFLLMMIILLWITGAYFIYDLSNRSASMLKENYQTVESTKFLIQSIDEIKNEQLSVLFRGNDQQNDSLYRVNLDVFSKNLLAAKNNITESGEEELIHELETSFHTLLSVCDSLASAMVISTESFHRLIFAHSDTRSYIVALWDLNMRAISHKNNQIKNTSHRAFVIMSLIGSICFIISALFFFRYPGYVSKPITLLTQGIKEIANRNYEKRLPFKSHDELGELARSFNQMAAKLDEYEHSNLSKLLLEKKRIDTIINNMKDAIIGLDESEKIIFANTVACDILRLNSSEITGYSARDLMQQNETFSLIFKDISEKRNTANKEFHPVKMTKDGKPDYYTREILDVSFAKTGEDDPVSVGRVMIMKNITHFLEQAEAKTNFIATISHELKTPISSLRLNLKLLDDPRIGKLNEEQKDIVRALKEETLKMSGITSELLDLAQVETGNIPLNFQPVSPAEIIRYVKNPALNQAGTKHIQIDFSVADQLPEIYCDSEKTAWVLLNMLNNAILYSPDGSSVEVEVKQVKDSIRFMVRDFGMGIEEQYLQQIFEKYFRVPDSGQKGTGLGLAISKEFISKQNGRIWVESTPGKGSRFFFDLPLYHSPRLKS